MKPLKWKNINCGVISFPLTHGRSFPDEKSITVSNLFVDPPVDITIPLNPEMNLSSNSQLYFKKYNKLKKRKEIGAEKIKNADTSGIS